MIAIQHNGGRVRSKMQTAHITEETAEAIGREPDDGDMADGQVIRARFDSLASEVEVGEVS